MSDDDELATLTESAEEYVDKARLRSLFDARDEAAAAIRRAPLRDQEAKARGLDAGSQLVDSHVRSSVVAYVLECEPLFKNTSVGIDYWQSCDLGAVPLPTPPEGDGYATRSVRGVADGLVDGRSISIPGIRQYVRLPSPITVTFTDFDGTHERQTTIPRSISEDVFRNTNKLLADLGIGLDAEAIEDGDASFDYSDLL